MSRKQVSFISITLAGLLALTSCGRQTAVGPGSGEGTLVIRAEFDRISPFSNGLAAVSVKKKWGYIDKTGTTVVAPRFDNAGDFSEGLAVVTVAVPVEVDNAAAAVLAAAEAADNINLKDSIYIIAALSSFFLGKAALFL